jgi:hypothetical protein
MTYRVGGEGLERLEELERLEVVGEVGGCWRGWRLLEVLVGWRSLEMRQKVCLSEPGFIRFTWLSESGFIRFKD